MKLLKASGSLHVYTHECASRRARVRSNLNEAAAALSLSLSFSLTRADKMQRINAARGRRWELTYLADRPSTASLLLSVKYIRRVSSAPALSISTCVCVWVCVYLSASRCSFRVFALSQKRER